MLSFNLDTLDFAKGGGTVTVVVQDARSGTILMIAHADREALERTIATGEMHFLSRTRGPWHKGATSGNTQRVVTLAADCDGDAVLARVIPAGPACHTGTMSCFGPTTADPLQALDAVIAERSSSLHAEQNPDAAGSYTQRLLSDRNLRLKKLGEEAAELVLACADGDRSRSIEEAADLLYHTLVALQAMGARLSDVAEVLDRRRQA